MGVAQRVYYKKIGNVVTLAAAQNVSVSTVGAYYLDLTIPDGYKPSLPSATSVTMKTGTTYSLGRVNISTDGKILYDIGATGMREFRWSISYIVD